MEKFKNVMTTENLVDFLDQKPRVDRYSGNVYFHNAAYGRCAAGRMCVGTGKENYGRSQEYISS